MIVGMKKVAVLCMAEHSESALKKLRDLGILHISSEEPQADSTPENLRSDSTAADNAIRIISAYKPEKNERSLITDAGEAKDAKGIVSKIIEKDQTIRKMSEKLDALLAERRALEPLGAFEPADVTDLLKKGIHVRLFTVTSKKLPELPENTFMFEINSGSPKIIAIAGTAPFEFEGIEIPLPSRSLDAVEKERAAAINKIQAATIELSALSRHKDFLTSYAKTLAEEVRFTDVMAGMGKSGRVAYLQGFCPVDSIEAIQTSAKNNGWGLLVTEPTSDDQVPTLIRNAKWFRPIKALFDLIDISPGYAEVDAGPLILLFFSLFFAMLVGDAAYGAIYLGLTMLARKLMPKAPPQPFRLLYILSIATIVWGVITCNYFGSSPAALARFSIDWLLTDKNMMSLCFLIGAIHLTIAHVWNLARTINSTRALAQAGWIALTWSMYFGARYLVLSDDLPSLFKYMFVPGLLLVVIFMTPPRNLKTEWHNHVMLPFDVINNFVDVVSYVRLFAVGGSSLAVAQAFNALAVGSGIDGWMAGLIAALVLFIGHALNLALSVMSVLVHGIRLNTLEFSGHLGLEWSGFKYNPFRRESGSGSE